MVVGSRALSSTIPHKTSSLADSALQICTKHQVLPTVRHDSPHRGESNFSIVFRRPKIEASSFCLNEFICEINKRNDKKKTVDERIDEIEERVKEN